MDVSQLAEHLICERCAAEMPSDVAFCRQCGAALGHDQLVGKVIDGRYEVLRRVGEGGMGAVYEVQHVRLAKRFAMKVIRRGLTEVSGFARRFEREALATSKQKHPNCVAVTDFGRAETGELYLVMEFLEGRSLSQCLGQPMPVSKVLNVVRQILLALEHAHCNGVVHRDIKADNVMLLDAPDSGWLIKVLDFGLAVAAIPGQSTHVTQTHMVAGTPTYMAPEQAARMPVDERSDLYAVGVLMFYLLTGRPPFTGEGPVELLNRKLTSAAPSLDTVVPGVFSKRLQSVVARALERRPQDRFGSATEFLQELSEIQNAPGAGLAPAPTNPLHRGVERLAGGWLACGRSAFEQWYQGKMVQQQGANGRPSWAVRLRTLFTSSAGRVVFGSAATALLFAAFAVWGIAYSLQLSQGGKGSSVARKPVARQSSSQPSWRKAPATKAEPRDLEKRVALVRLLIARGACREAAQDTEALIREQPRSALAHYLYGSAQMCRGRIKSGLQAYRRAIELDPGYRKDSSILEDVAPLLSAPAARDSALAFLTGTVGAPAADLLLDATTSPDAKVRAGAIEAVTKLNRRDEIDWITVLHLDLSQQRSCDERAETVARLREVGNERALKVLLDAREARKGRRRLKHACVIKQIDEAIAHLRRNHRG